MGDLRCPRCGTTAESSTVAVGRFHTCPGVFERIGSASDPSGAEMRSPKDAIPPTDQQVVDRWREQVSPRSSGGARPLNEEQLLEYAAFDPDRDQTDFSSYRAAARYAREIIALRTQVSALRQQLADSENWKGRCIAERLDLAAARQEAETLRKEAATLNFALDDVAATLGVSRDSIDGELQATIEEAETLRGQLEKANRDLDGWEKGALEFVARFAPDALPEMRHVLGKEAAARVAAPREPK